MLGDRVDVKVSNLSHSFFSFSCVSILFLFRFFFFFCLCFFFCYVFSSPFFNFHSSFVLFFFTSYFLLSFSLYISAYFFSASLSYFFCLCCCIDSASCSFLALFEPNYELGDCSSLDDSVLLPTLLQLFRSSLQVLRQQRGWRRREGRNREKREEESIFARAGFLNIQRCLHVDSEFVGLCYSSVPRASVTDRGTWVGLGVFC